MQKSKLNEDQAETIFYFAYVFSGPLSSFEAIRDYALKFCDAKLIYQKYSARYLRTETERVTRQNEYHSRNGTFGFCGR